MPAEIPERNGVPLGVAAPDIRQVTTVFVADTELPAESCICPECNVLWIEMSFDTSTLPWTGTCPNGHTWPIAVPL